MVKVVSRMEQGNKEMEEDQVDGELHVLDIVCLEILL